LEHRNYQLKNNTEDRKFGDMHLYFGCRTPDDYLYRDKLNAFKEENESMKLYVSMSREDPIIFKHVQVSGDL